MKILFTFFLFLIFAQYTYADCNIDLYSSTYLSSSQVLSGDHLIKKSDCSLEINSELTNLLANKRGSFSTRHLQNILNEKDKGLITISPKQITLSPISDIVPARMLEGNQKVASAILKFQPQVIHLDHDQKVQFQLGIDKLSPGKQSVKIDIVNTSTNSIKTIWLELHIKTQINAIVPTQQISAYSPLRNLRYKKIWVDTPSLYVTDLNKLHFYQSRAYITQDTPLRNRDVHPITLVKSGVPTKVILRNKNIILTTMALPYQNGYLGSEVTLRNIKTGRKLRATVTNNNEVEIKL
jgi:flagella basal body P-ring formation protein FlgA